MRRRQLIKFVGAAAATRPFAARPQQSKPIPKIGVSIPKIGVLWHAGNEHEEAIYLGALRQGFSERPIRVTQFSGIALPILPRYEVIE